MNRDGINIQIHEIFGIFQDSMLVIAVEVAIVVGLLTLILLRFGRRKAGKRLSDDVSVLIRHKFHVL